MKAMPKDELILLLQAGNANMVSPGEISQLFETYGDDYVRDYHGYRSRDNVWKQTSSNEYRKAKVFVLRKEMEDGRSDK